MNVSWLEVSLGFFAIAYVAAQATCQGALAFHGVNITILSVGVCIYGVAKGTYAAVQWCLRKDKGR